MAKQLTRNTQYVAQGRRSSWHTHNIPGIVSELVSCYSLDYFQLHILHQLGVEHPLSAGLVHLPMPCVHTNQFCTRAVREKKWSNRQQQQRFSYMMTGRCWFHLRFQWWECTSSGWRIQSLGHHRSSYKQKIIWQRVTRADARHAIICPKYHGMGRTTC